MSHSATATTTAAIDSVKINGRHHFNAPPAVPLTSPAAGARYTLPVTVTLTANATDPEGRMASVDFYAGTTPITRDTSTPYTHRPAGRPGTEPPRHPHGSGA